MAKNIDLKSYFTGKMRNRIKKPSIERLARRAGVKNIANDCYPLVRRLILGKLHQLAKVTLIANSENHTKTLMPSDINAALSILGHNVAKSSSLGTNTCAK